LETDFRDLNGVLVVSHDPPLQNQVYTSEKLFAAYAKINSAGRIAMNVKADGLQSMLSKALKDAGVPIENVFAFDMSIPDALGYLRQDFPAYTRLSEYEENPSFLDLAKGIWVDNFSGQYPQVERALALLHQGYRVALVSPEIHQRDPTECWAEINASGLHTFENFELCTDLPEQAFESFGDRL
jgi:hypothetical protein